MELISSWEPHSANPVEMDLIWVGLADNGFRVRRRFCAIPLLLLLFAKELHPLLAAGNKAREMHTVEQNKSEPINICTVL